MVGLCHGNLKPENILIGHALEGSGSGRPLFEVRVTDFQPFGLLNPEIVVRIYTAWGKVFGTSF